MRKGSFYSLDAYFEYLDVLQDNGDISFDECLSLRRRFLDFVSYSSSCDMLCCLSDGRII